MEDIEGFYEHHSPEEVRDAFERELTRAAEEDRPFSPLAFIASLDGSGLQEISPGNYIAYFEPGTGGWNSGSC